MFSQRGRGGGGGLEGEASHPKQSLAGPAQVLTSSHMFTPIKNIYAAPQWSPHSPHTITCVWGEQWGAATVATFSDDAATLKQRGREYKRQVQVGQAARPHACVLTEPSAHNHTNGPTHTQQSNLPRNHTRTCGAAGVRRGGVGAAALGGVLR